MKHPVRALTALFVVGAVGLAPTACSIGSTGSAAADNFPSKDITLLVPYEAGGPTDVSARAVAKVFEEEFGQTVVVENKPGGSGAKAAQEVISSAPDGHTIGLVTAGGVVLTPLSNDVGYSHDDLAHLGMVSEVPSLIAVGKDSPYTSAKEFFAAAKKSPGELTIAVPGASTMQAVELQRLKKEYGVNITAVPFDSSAEMSTALLGKNVDAVFISLSKDIPQFIDEGDMVPLAVSPEERLDWMPEVPTLRESGYEDLTLSGSTYSLAAPKDLPEEIVSKYEDAMETASQDPTFVKTVGKNYVRDEFCDADCIAGILDETEETYEPIIAK